MDRQREYNAILEQITREASLQAEQNLRAREGIIVEGRGVPGNLHNRLDIQARLGSRVAPIEEPVHPLQSRFGSDCRGQPLPSSYSHDLDQQERSLAGYSAQILSRLDTPMPLMDNPNFRTVPSRNHQPVQHGYFAENDLEQQDSFLSHVDHQILPLMDYPVKALPRLLPERRMLPQSGSLFENQDRSLPSRSIFRSPVYQRKHPSLPSRTPASLHSNVASMSSSSSPVPSTTRKSNFNSETGPTLIKTPLKSSEKKVVQSGNNQVKINTKSPVSNVKTIAKPQTNKTENAVKKVSTIEVKSKILMSSHGDKRLPSLFGPPPSSAPPYKGTDPKGSAQKPTAVTSNRDTNKTAVEIRSSSPKPLMDLTPSLTSLPFSDSMFSEPNPQLESALSREKKNGSLNVSTTQLEPVAPSGKPVPLLDIKPVPHFTFKPLSFCNNSSSESPGNKDTLLSKSVNEGKSKLIESKDESAARIEGSQNEIPSKGLTGEKGFEQTKGTKLPSSSKTLTESGVSPSDNVVRPLWYTNANSLCMQSGSEASIVLEDDTATEVEEGEIIGDTCSDEMDVNDHEGDIASNLVCSNVSVGVTENAAVSSYDTLKKFFATPEKFARFLPFPAEASKDNVKRIERCWKQLLILPSFKMNIKSLRSRKIINRIKSHFTKGTTKPTGSFIQFCFKLWCRIATCLGAYLQRRHKDFVQGLVHRSMVDFTLIRMHKKKMPRSLKDLPVKAQINLLYVFNTQGFTNATNNYMVKWLQDELVKLSSGLTVNPAVVNPFLSHFVVDDQLVEKKFCLFDYLKVKVFTDDKEKKQCRQICTSLNCQEYMPNTEWKFEQEENIKADQTGSIMKATTVAKPILPTLALHSSAATCGKEAVLSSVVSSTPNKGSVPKDVTLQGEHAQLESSSVKTVAQIAPTQSEEVKSFNGDSKSVKISNTPSIPASSKRCVQANACNDTIGVESTVVEKTGTIPLESYKEKAENKLDTKGGGSGQPVISNLPDIIVTPVLVEVSDTIVPTNHPLPLSDASSSKPKMEPHPESSSTGKWRMHSQTVECSSNSSISSRPGSRKRKLEMMRRGRKRYVRSRHQLSSVDGGHVGYRSSSGQSQRSDVDGRVVHSGSDSEDLEMMKLRKNALLSMLKGSIAKKSSDGDSKEEMQTESKLKVQAQPKGLHPSTDKSCIEQISDTEGTTSPVVHPITESDVVLVSLGPDSVVPFPSQYSGTVTQSDDNVQQILEAKSKAGMTKEMQSDNVDTKPQNSTAADVSSKLKTSEVMSPHRSSNESVAAYYKVSTGNADQKLSDKGKQSFVICVTSEDSESDDGSDTAPHSTVTSGTSSPMPVQQGTPPTRKDLEELIQHYKRRAKEKEAAPLRSDQGALKSPDAIKSMPQPKQAEYRSLKQQIAQLEKKKTERNKVLVTKRKPTTVIVSDAKKQKLDVASNEAPDANLQLLKALDSKKQIEYQTNIAICEVQLEELKVTIDRGCNEVAALNKQLNDCISEIEEHTIKLQLLNKQLKIAKDALDQAQTKQLEIKKKVKSAQNNLLKEKNALTVLEGELASYCSLLTKLQQHKQRSPNQEGDDVQLSVGITESVLQSKWKELDMDTTEKSVAINFSESPLELKGRELYVTDMTVVASSSATVDEKMLAHNVPMVVSPVVEKYENSSDHVVAAAEVLPTATSSTGNVTGECAITSNSSSNASTFMVTRDAKLKPGQKIANVVKKLSQERVTHAPSNSTETDESTIHVDEKGTRRSLDAVVAKLHTVKKQELDKRLYVDLGLPKQVTEYSKLDNVVQKLVAMQSHSISSFPSYPIQFRSPVTSSAVNSSLDTTASLTVPDSGKVDGETKKKWAEVEKVAAIMPTATKDDTRAKAVTQTSASIVITNTEDDAAQTSGKLQIKLTGVPVVADVKHDKSDTNNIEIERLAEKKPTEMATLHTTAESKQEEKISTQSKMQRVAKAPGDIEATTRISNDAELKRYRTVIVSSRMTNLQQPELKKEIASTSVQKSSPTEAPVASVKQNTQKELLANITKSIVEKYSIKSADLESLLTTGCIDEPNEMLNDSTCDTLTGFHIERLQEQQVALVPGIFFAEMFQPVQELSSVGSVTSSWNSYKSPLGCFKSYRLHPYYRTRAKLTVSSSTYSNKIVASKIMCKFDTVGKCSDKDCKWQHWNETQLNSSEMFSDLVSYAPDVAAVTDSDDVPAAKQKINTHIGNMIGNLGGKMTTDEIGVYLVDQVVSASDNSPLVARIEKKLPALPCSEADSSTNVQRPRSFSSDFKAVFDPTCLQLGTLGQVSAKSSTQPPDRYFISSLPHLSNSCASDPKAVVSSVRDKLSHDHNEDKERVHISAVTLLEAALRINPNEEVLWIELLKIHASKLISIPYEHGNLYLFQNVCERAIKATNSYSVYQECISLLPTYNLKKMLYIKAYNATKLKVNEVERSLQCLELFLGSVVLDHMTGHTVGAVEKMRFSLQANEYRNSYSFKDLLDHLTCDDVLLLWMVYIYYCYSHTFPACVIKSTASGCRILGKKTFIIQWKEGDRLRSLYNTFIQQFKMALKKCKSIYGVRYPHHTSSEYVSQFQNLFENLILLEYKCGNLEAAKISIRKVLPVQPSCLGLWLLLADVVVKCGYTEGYKEVYVEAENKLKGNSEFYFFVSKKLHQQGNDDDALRWLTFCVYSKYNAKPLNKSEYEVILHYRKLLKQPVPYDFQSSGVILEKDAPCSAYLWLCYCMFVELAVVPEMASEYWPTAEDAYEAAVHSVHSPFGMKLVWKEYLVYLKSIAIQGAGQSNWKQFLNGINRAFQVVDAEDYKFQLEVAEMCIAALPADHSDVVLALYNHWIKMFPDNKQLVCRCSDAAVKSDHIEMAQYVLATYLTNNPDDWNIWKKAIDIEIKLKNIKEVRWMFWEASKSSLFNIFFWREFLKFELQQCILTEDTPQVTTVLQRSHHLGINLSKLVSRDLSLS